MSSFSLRSNHLAHLAVFHRKTLKSFLSLSKTAATPAIHFILGELPMEGKIHRDVFSLFYSVWNSPDSKIYHIVKYLLKMAPEISHTWCAHIRTLSMKYKMWDPLVCLFRDPPSKSEYREYVLTKITAYYEQELRVMARSNSCMQYLHVEMTGLRGKHHPAITNITSPKEVQKMRPHMKMLCGNLLTYQTKFNQSGVGSPHCRLCGSKFENLSHIIGSCQEFKEIRTKLLKEFESELLSCVSNVKIQDFTKDEDLITQFILDPTSMNLPYRVHLNDPIVLKLFSLSRDMCFSINKRRSNLLQKLKNEKSSVLKS